MLTSLLDGAVMAERHGATPPSLIAMHGWGRNRFDWNATLAGCDALALDLPGFGASAAPEDVWTTERYAQFLLPLLDDDRPQVLLGHSFGGRVAVHMARLRPQAVAGLVLTGVPLLRADLPGGNAKTKPALKYRMVRWLRSKNVVSEATMDKLRNHYGSDDYRNAQGAMRGILVAAVNEDYTDCLTAIREAGIPVEFVWGADDPIVPTAVATNAARILDTTGKVDIVTGSGHNLDHNLATRLRDALTRLGVGPAR